MLSHSHPDNAHRLPSGDTFQGVPSAHACTPSDYMTPQVNRGTRALSDKARVTQSELSNEQGRQATCVGP